MSSASSEGGIHGVARAFAWWAGKHESLEARQVLAGLSHLGDFLKAVSNADIDLEKGSLDSESLLERRASSADSSHSQDSDASDALDTFDFQQSLDESLKEDNFTPETFENTFSNMEVQLLKKLGFLEERNASLHHSLSTAICVGTPTKAHYEKARNLCNSRWILTESLRRELYFHLFIPTGTDRKQPNLLIFEDIIRGKIALIRGLQCFMLHFVDIENDILQNLRFFVDDAIALLKILKHPLPSDTLQIIEEYNPFHHFRLHGRERWNHSLLHLSDDEINVFWENYQNNLCDALFGLWNLPDQNSWLHERDEPNSVRSILGCFNLNPRESKNVPDLDSKVFDASFIVSNGPFRFKRTNYLHQHLSVEGNDILVFTEWQKLAGIRHHAVLRHPDDFCMFDILTSENRYNPPHTINIRSYISRLHYSLLATLFLLFFQTPVRHSALRVHSGKSYRIARDLGIELDAKDIKSLVDEILEHSTWESFLDCTTEARLQDPFMVPLDRLYNTLTSWRPRKFWEMRYPGYGSVDVVQLYGFHFGLMVGIAAIIALVLTAAQTYTGFKALQH